MDCKRNRVFIDKRVFVNGRQSAIDWDNSVEAGFLPQYGLTNQVLIKCSDKDYHCRWEDLNNIIANLNPFTFDNALTENNGLVTWGGDLIQDTVVDGVSTYNVTFETINNFILNTVLDNTIYAANNNYFTSAVDTILNAGNNYNVAVGNNMGINVVNSFDVQSTDYTNIANNSYNIESQNLFTLTTNQADMNQAFPGSFLQILDTNTGEAEWSDYSMPLVDGLEGQILVVQSDGNLDYEYPEITDVGNTLFVSKLGDDTTAQRESLDKHFLTLAAANNAAQDGDIIIVYPGLYAIESSQIAIQPNVNYEFKSGVIIEITIDLVTDAPVKFGGNQSITGLGEIVMNFSSPILSYELSNLIQAGSNYISIDLKRFEFNKSLIFKCNNVNQFLFNCQYVNAIEGLWVSELSSETSVHINWGKVNHDIIGIGLHSLVYASELTRGSSFLLNIDDLFLINKAIKASVLRTAITEEGSVININVNKVNGNPLLGDPDVFDKMRYAFYENTLCFGRKDINITGYNYGAIMYQPIANYSTSNDEEFGSMKLAGNILDNGIGFGGYVKVNISYSSLYINLDIVNLNSSGYTLLGDSNSPNKSYVHVTGRLENTNSTDAPILLGSSSDTSVFFNDFTSYVRGASSAYDVVGNTIFPSIKLHNLDNRSNLDVNTTSVVPINQPIQTLFVNNLIR